MSRSVLPGSFAEVRQRLARLFGGGPLGDADAAEWLREALSASYAGVEDEGDLPVAQRGLALQRASGALLMLEEHDVPDLAFVFGLRQIVARAFARYFNGLMLDGPPWRLGPDEPDRPLWQDWARGAEFE